MSTLEDVVDFCKHAVDAEMNSDAGCNNRVAIIGGLILIVIGGATDLLQAVFRFIRPDYDSGLPSLALLLPMFFVGALLCVALVGYFTARGGKS